MESDDLVARMRLCTTNPEFTLKTVATQTTNDGYIRESKRYR